MIDRICFNNHEFLQTYRTYGAQNWGQYNLLLQTGRTYGAHFYWNIEPRSGALFVAECIVILAFEPRSGDMFVE